MTFRLAASSDRWLARAAREIEELLLDHAHCEKRAASAALGFCFRCPERRELVLAMSRVAREEMLHFERLQAVLLERGVGFRRQVPAEYPRRLASLARSWVPAKLFDDLLLAGLIEARSTERFARLAGSGAIDPGLRSLFAELADVESRHAGLYADLAAAVDPRADVPSRAADLASREAEILETPDAPLRLHAG